MAKPTSKEPDSLAASSAGVPSLHARRGILIGIGVLLFLGFLSRFAWQRAEPQIRSDSRYQVTAASIHITKQPEWLHNDVKLEALGRAGLFSETTEKASSTGLSILDEPAELEERVAMMLEFHPWVRAVGKISKSPPNQLMVEVEYRTPVAALSVGRMSVGRMPSSRTARGMQNNGSPNNGNLNNGNPSTEPYDLIPIDREGVLLLASDLDRRQLGFLPRIEVQNLLRATGTQAPRAGEQWTDPRIAGAIDLINRLGPIWYELSLLDIAPSPSPEVMGNQRYYVYDLRTNGGTTISWGAAPSIAPIGESPFEAKLARLQSYIAQNGPLNSVQSSPERIDIRSDTKVIPRMVKRKKSSPDKTRTAKAPSEKPITKTAQAPVDGKSATVKK